MALIPPCIFSLIRSHILRHINTKIITKIDNRITWCIPLLGLYLTHKSMSSSLKHARNYMKPIGIRTVYAYKYTIDTICLLAQSVVFYGIIMKIFHGHIPPIYYINRAKKINECSKYLSMGLSTYCFYVE